MADRIIWINDNSANLERALTTSSALYTQAAYFSISATRPAKVDRLGGEIIAARFHAFAPRALHRVRGQRHDLDAARHPASAAARCVASMPDITGIEISIRMRSGAQLLAFSTASAPFSAQCTS